MNSFVDVSGRVVIRLVGADSLDFIQRISTNDVANLQVGQSRQTVLTNEKGRIIEVVVVHRSAESQLLLAGESKETGRLISWIEKYIIMEDIKIEAITSSFSQYILYDGDVVEQARLTSVRSHGSITMTEELGSLRLVRVVSPLEVKDQIEQTLTGMGITRRTKEELEAFRILNGIPGAQTELTPQFNPLEANLGNLISWTKGCYIGQEVIARLDTYKKVQRHLVTMSMSDLPENLPIPFLDDEGEAGVITSVTRIASTSENRGIGYLKTSGSDRSRTHFFLKYERKVPLQVYTVAS